MKFLQLKRMRTKVEQKLLQMKTKLEWESSRRKNVCADRQQLSTNNLFLQKIVDVGQLSNTVRVEYIRLVSIKLLTIFAKKLHQIKMYKQNQHKKIIEDVLQLSPTQLHLLKLVGLVIVVRRSTRYHLKKVVCTICY